MYILWMNIRLHYTVTVSCSCWFVFLLQAFQQELASRQAMVEAIRSSVGDDPAVNTQLNELNDLWDHVNQLSDARDYRLQDALKLVSVTGFDCL